MPPLLFCGTHFTCPVVFANRETQWRITVFRYRNRLPRSAITARVIESSCGFTLNPLALAVMAVPSVHRSLIEGRRFVIGFR